MAKKEQQKCMIDNCEVSAKNFTRGLCYRHYPIACNMVTARQTTWEELMVLGLASGTIVETYKGQFMRIIEERRKAKK